MIFEGALSVKAILESQKRDIKCVYINEKKQSKDINYILHLCHKNNVKVKRVSVEIIDELATGHTHGGILIDAGHRKVEPLDLSHDFYLYLEGIEDPYNIGGIIRTAAIAGCQTVLLSHRDYSSMENTILKSSAGTSERINWVVCDEEVKNLVQLKQAKIKLIAAKRDKKSIPMTQANFKQPLCLLIGGEKRGLSRTVVELSDHFVQIFYPTQIKAALSAAASAAVLCFEVVKQRMEQ